MLACKVSKGTTRRRVGFNLLEVSEVEPSRFGVTPPRIQTRAQTSDKLRIVDLDVTPPQMADVWPSHTCLTALRYEE